MRSIKTISGNYELLLLLILDLMQKSPRHLTADEIFAQARREMPNIARGTVYRNLKLM